MAIINTRKLSQHQKKEMWDTVEELVKIGFDVQEISRRTELTEKQVYYIMKYLGIKCIKTQTQVKEVERSAWAAAFKESWEATCRPFRAAAERGADGVLKTDWQRGMCNAHKELDCDGRCRECPLIVDRLNGLCYANSHWDGKRWAPDQAQKARGKAPGYEGGNE